MGVMHDRALAVQEMLADHPSLDTETVQVALACGRHQAARAIRQGRELAADEGKRVSYATAANQYQVVQNGSGPERVRSYTSRLQSIATQRMNAGRVMSASVDHGRSSKLERAVTQMALADMKRAEADRIQLQAYRELLDS